MHRDLLQIQKSALILGERQNVLVALSEVPIHLVQ